MATFPRFFGTPFAVGCAAFLALSAAHAVAQQPYPYPPQPYPGQQQAYPYPPQGYPQQPYPGQPPQPQPQPYQPQQAPTYYPPQGGAAPAPYSVQPPANARKEDDRELDRLGAQFYAIRAGDPNAVEKLGKLEREVHEFRTNLGYHGYDAGDILKDAKKLEHRIATKRQRLEAASARPMPPAPGPHPLDAPYSPSSAQPPTSYSPMQQPPMSPPPPTDAQQQMTPAPAPPPPEASSQPQGAAPGPTR